MLTNPTEIARETLRRLAMRRALPTPENYAESYREISGETPAADWAAVAAEQLKSRGAPFEALADAIAAHSADAVENAVQALIDSKHSPEVSAAARELLALTLHPTIVARFEPKFDSAALMNAVREATSVSNLVAPLRSIRQFWATAASSVESDTANATLLDLLRSLVTNIADILADESLIEANIAALHAIIADPGEDALEQARRNLHQALLHQEQLRRSMDEAKATFKKMVAGIIDGLGRFSASAGGYHDQLVDYAKKINAADDLTQINAVVAQLVEATKVAQESAQHTQHELDEAKRLAETTQQRVQELESELDRVNAKVREDQLTGILNRRGLEEAFERERARAVRRGTPMCVALLDIDNFKRLNDTHGHHAGDAALMHLANVVRDTVRPHDVVSRYGGEEFVLVLPDTSIDAAKIVLTRLQRELTKRFFLHDNDRLLITFSAGVTACRAGEARETAIERADQAMYRAKHEGKNRVCTAE